MQQQPGCALWRAALCNDRKVPCITTKCIPAVEAREDSAIGFWAPQSQLGLEQARADRLYQKPSWRQQQLCAGQGNEASQGQPDRASRIRTCKIAGASPRVLQWPKSGPRASGMRVWMWSNDHIWASPPPQVTLPTRTPFSCPILPPPAPSSASTGVAHWLPPQVSRG